MMLLILIQLGNTLHTSKGSMSLYDDILQTYDDLMIDIAEEIIDGETQCEVNADCGNVNYFICNKEKRICVHKNIFPIRPKEIVGTGVIMLLVALSVMSGIGGGGIIVPLNIYFFNFDTKRSVSISGVTILIGSLLRFAYTFKSKHPEKDAVCIDYSVTNIMLPTVLMGSILGVFFNLIFPQMVLDVCLSTLLILLCFNSSWKATSLYKQESE
jgi:hypothetical protein